jgi:hypothetical protein
MQRESAPLGSHHVSAQPLKRLTERTQRMTMTQPDLDEFIADQWHRSQIRDALQRYCRGLDRKNFDLVRSAYHEDGIDDHGGYQGGIDGLIAWMEERHKSVEQCMHSITNCIIERAGDVAVVETYCLSYQRYYTDGAGGAEDTDIVHTDREREQVMAAVRFIDRFERRESGWKVAYRKVAFEAAWTEPVTSEFPPAGWTKLRRDERDTLWTERQAVLGLGYDQLAS